jgi:simple sugar transport system permease protein
MKWRESNTAKAIGVSLLAILLSLLAISIIILLIGKNPLSALQSILQGSGWLPKAKYSSGTGQITDLFYMADALTPMIFAALAVAVAFKAGLFNIGVSGQMLLAGFVATVAVGYSGLPRIAAYPLVLIIGLLTGALAGGLIGFLKFRFNINEVVSSIMLNYIFQYVISFFINTRFIDPVSRQSKAIKPDVRLTLMDIDLGGYHLRIPLCIILALLCAALIWIFFTKTKPGFELKAVGRNRKAALYAGIRVGKSLVFAMVISGGLAGLAGVTYYLGFFNSIQPNSLSPLGFDAIATAFLGNAHPIAIIAASILITSLSRGSTYMSSSIGVRPEIASLITGMILLFSACSAWIRYRMENRSLKKIRAIEGAAPGADMHQGQSQTKEGDAL